MPDYSGMRWQRSVGALFACVVLAVAMTTASSTWGAPGELTVSVIDVGQGDSIWVEFPNGKHMLIDAGDVAADAEVLAFLRQHSTTRLNALVVSHFDADHIGGMPPVIAAPDLQISEFWVSGQKTGEQQQTKLEDAVRDRGLTPTVKQEGMHGTMGGVKVDVLGPGSHVYSGKNNNSIVLRLTYGNVSFLFPGDMEKSERKALGKDHPWTHADVLKLAHHGSCTGTDCTFAQQVSPKYAVMSYAYGNRHQHPHQEAVNALTLAHAKLYGTAPHGTVTFTTDGVTLGPPQTTRQGTVAPCPHKLQCPSEKEKKAAGVTGPAGAAAAGTTLVGNSNTKVYHKASCRHAPTGSNRIIFQSASEANAQGYRACGTCKP